MKNLRIFQVSFVPEISGGFNFDFLGVKVPGRVMKCFSSGEYPAFSVYTVIDADAFLRCTAHIGGRHVILFTGG